VWPEPTTAVLAPGDLVRVELALDDGAGSREWLARPASPPLARFEAVGPSAEAQAVPIVGLAGARPAGAFRPDRPGTWIVAYESTPRDHQLSAEQFEHYLAEEGLTRAAELRAALGEVDLPARERWSRHTKALVEVGDAPVLDRNLGLELELTLVAASATEIRARVSARGRPVADALVDLRLDDASSQQARSDAEGEVVFACRPGPLALTTATIDREQGAPAWRGRFAALFFVHEAPCTPLPQ
jgi:hypothetical protein